MPTGKLMIFCTCAEYKKEHYLKRVSDWYHNLKAIESLKSLEPDFYVFNDGVITLEDIKAVDPSMLHDNKLFIINHAPMVGRLSDLSFPGWVRSFKHAMNIGLEADEHDNTRYKYDYVVHIENDVLLLHPDKIVSYFDKPGMFCSKWKGRDIIDSTVMVMNDKESIKKIMGFLNTRDDANCMLIEGIFTPLGNWQFVFNGDRLNGELSHLSMDLDFIAQLWRSEVRNPYSKAISDIRVNHLFVAGGDDLVIPENQMHYIPIQCGAITSKPNPNWLHDYDHDDNISGRYGLYGPLTALYSIYKHHNTLSDTTGVGFFCEDMWLTNGMIFVPNVRWDQEHQKNIAPCCTDLVIVPKDTDRKLCSNPEYVFKNFDAVVPRRQVQFRNGNIKNVIAFMTSEFGYPIYSEIESILRRKHYDYAYDVWKDYAMDELAPQIQRPIFILPWKHFRPFCELFFDICFELEKKFKVEFLIESYYKSKEGDTHIFQRLLCYILGLYLYRNHLVAKETSVIYYHDGAYNYEQPFNH